MAGPTHVGTVTEINKTAIAPAAAAGQLILLQVTSSQTRTFTPIPPTGYLPVYSQADGFVLGGEVSWLYYKFAVGGAADNVSLVWNSVAPGQLKAIKFANVASIAVTAVRRETDNTYGGIAPASYSIYVPSVNYTEARSGLLVTLFNCRSATTRVLATPTGWTAVGETFSNSDRANTAFKALAGAAGATAASEWVCTSVVTSGNHGDGWHSYTLALTSADQAPDAPTLVSPTGGQTVDRTAINRFRWIFSDPDPGDSQSVYELRYRATGDVAWTTVGPVTSPNSFHDFAAGTFATGDYEWQARVKDALGEQGPFSPSSFFSIQIASDAPTILTPTNGSVIHNTPEILSWAAPSQTDFQWRRVADASGIANTAVVYADSGDVVGNDVRSVPVVFPTNNRFEHLQLRIKDSGLWTEWASVRVEVSYTPPPAPTVDVAVYQVDAMDAALQITVTNP